MVDTTRRSTQRRQPSHPITRAGAHHPPDRHQCRNKEIDALFGLRAILSSCTPPSHCPSPPTAHGPRGTSSNAQPDQLAAPPKRRTARHRSPPSGNVTPTTLTARPRNVSSKCRFSRGPSSPPAMVGDARKPASPGASPGRCPTRSSDRVRSVRCALQRPRYESWLRHRCSTCCCYANPGGIERGARRPEHRVRATPDRGQS